MARISGITLPNDKRVEVALTYLYGIGRPKAKKILDEAAIDINKRVKDLSDNEINRLREIIGREPIEGDLRRIVSRNIKHMQEIGSYKGMRHKKRLPARGQRTKTNGRTKRGKRVTVGSGKVKLTKT